MQTRDTESDLRLVGEHLTEFCQRRSRMGRDQTTDGVVCCRRNPWRIIASARLGSTTTGVTKTIDHTPDKTKTDVKTYGQVANRAFPIAVSVKESLSQIKGVSFHCYLPLDTQDFMIIAPLKNNIKM
jgi:hypothetical protein